MCWRLRPPHRPNRQGRRLRYRHLFCIVQGIRWAFPDWTLYRRDSAQTHSTGTWTQAFAMPGDGQEERKMAAEFRFCRMCQRQKVGTDKEEKETNRRIPQQQSKTTGKVPSPIERPKEEICRNRSAKCMKDMDKIMPWMQAYQGHNPYGALIN